MVFTQLTMLITSLEISKKIGEETPHPVIFIIRGGQNLSV